MKMHACTCRGSNIKMHACTCMRVHLLLVRLQTFIDTCYIAAGMHIAACVLVHKFVVYIASCFMLAMSIMVPGLSRITWVWFRHSGNAL